MYYFRSLLLALCATLCLSANAEEVTFNLVTENFPPYNMSVNDAEYEHRPEDITGLITDVVKQIFTKAKIGYTMKLRNWSYAYNYAQRKEFRGVFGTTLTDARKPLFKWVGPIASDGWVLYAKGGSTIKINSIEDAKKYKIGAYKGDVREQWLLSNGFETSSLDDDALNPKRLQNGQIDLWISGPVSGPYYAAKNGVTNIKPVFTVRETQLFLAVNKETPDEYVNKLNEALEKMRSSGELDKITARYR
ncbi:transporter substrate-binding domain-containing protein [Hahella sp. KA22]|uniref:substrate-binding periplasmic protein n=1 Tax=Hahella sp. KA22 TaxID=1628392 RepID=UPI000FDEB8F2|nr:ABC transporter substrate-binding protein [Hahella sp. KA22]AZZ93741.1 transporter substrate-binding domain-containing protein [Hahella sp. KA22]QAY57115.1 transporter substrate-binding domain-containing protein [Hahella sp. KA22]